MLQRLVVFSFLFGIWIVLSGNLDAAHLSMGVISCGLVTWISGDLMFAAPNKTVKQMLGEAWRLTLYIPWLMKEVVLANINVLSLALGPRGLKKVDPRIVHYRTGLKSEFARFIFANSITLTPGTITMEIHGPDLYVHAINPATAEGLGGLMEQKIARIFNEELEGSEDHV